MDENKFKKSRRFVLVKECITKGKEIGTDMSTLFMCLASLTDKGLTKFHKEFMTSNQTSFHKKVLHDVSWQQQKDFTFRPKTTA